MVFVALLVKQQVSLGVNHVEDWFVPHAAIKHQ